MENILEERIQLDSNEIGENLDETILMKLKEKIGNKCIIEGYVYKESIEILSRSIGKIITTSYKGELDYILKYKVKICNPKKGEKVKGTVRIINKMGILLDNNPLEIILARQQHMNKELLEVEIGDKLEVTILGRKYDLNDNKIICIGKLN